MCRMAMDACRSSLGTVNTTAAWQSYAVLVVYIPGKGYRQMQYGR